jgi:hypothetical protein
MRRQEMNREKNDNKRHHQQKEGSGQRLHGCGKQGVDGIGRQSQARRGQGAE